MRANPRSVLAALGTVTVIASVALSATPAFANGAWFNARMNDATIAAAGGQGKVFAVETLGEFNITHPTLTFDFSGISGFATPSFPDATDNCVITGETATCALPEAPADQQIDLTVPLELTPGPAAKNGVTGTIAFTATADGAESDSGSAKVTVVDGPDLVVANDPGSDNKTAKPGDRVNLTWALSNQGSKATQAVLLLFDVSHGVTVDSFQNCLYKPWPEDNGTQVLCEVDGPFNPGDVWVFDPGLTGAIAPDSATFARADLLVDSYSSNDLAGAAKSSAFAPKGIDGRWTTRTASKKLVAKAANGPGPDVDYSDNMATWAYQIKTDYDMVGVGATVHGSVGDTVNVTVGVKDNGPASLDTWSSHEWVTGFVVTVPTWAEVVTVPANCEAADSPTGGEHGQKIGYPFYICWDADTYFLEAGKAYTEKLGLKIKSTAGKDGSAALDTETGGDLHDRNPSNDSGAITLAKADDGGLPVTGSKTGLIAGAGGVLLLLGIGFVVLGQRRKRTA